MTDYPGFIAIETGGDNSLPLAIAWALPNGQIKNTLIQPDDEWLKDELLSLGGYDLDELRHLGISPLDVIRELENDHFSETLYTAGVQDDEAALSLMFDDFGVDPFVELEPAANLYPELDAGEWSRARSELFGEMGLEPLRPEHEVQVMLYLHQRLVQQDE
ncbi:MULTISPECIES: hypothetical protein [Salinicola]|uniref:Uncharacterized protein n=1 Tax=Salinicola socius TaxID=404433 RepID=A0A1Q8SU97_9GAMM|nr:MULTISPECIES: hypothetical protein [Salinicola]OLO05029.1 hypothetical protein BTW07_06410 [Salinicola socius]